MSKSVKGKKSKKSGFQHYYMCYECAEKKGGKMPPNHCCTVTSGKCEYCGDDKVTLIPYVDFKWPGKAFVWD